MSVENLGSQDGIWQDVEDDLFALQGVRCGAFDHFMLEIGEDTVIKVTPENIDQVEHLYRNYRSSVDDVQFEEQFPR